MIIYDNNLLGMQSLKTLIIGDRTGSDVHNITFEGRFHHVVIMLQ